MRIYEEQIEKLHRRMDRMKRAERRRVYRMRYAAVCAACLTVVVLAALFIAQLPFQAPVSGMEGMSASIFAENSSLGYIVIALIAFCLGAFVTIFCFRLKQREEKEEKPDD